MKKAQMFGWSDPRLMYNYWNPSKFATEVFYDPGFADNVDELKTKAQVERMDIESLISLWVVRYGDTLSYDAVQKPLDPFIKQVAKQLHKLGYLKAYPEEKVYKIEEVPHGLS